MTKIRIADFKARAELSAEEAEKARKIAAEVGFLQARIRRECEAGAPAWILGMARISLSFEDFPSEVSLRHENDYLKDVGLQREGEDACWRLKIEPETGRPTISDPYPVNIARIALRVMGVKPSQEALNSLQPLASWGQSAAEAVALLRQVSLRVPKHVLAASIARGSACMQALGLPKTQEMARAWVGACVDLGVELDTPMNIPPMVRYPSCPLLITLAAKGDLHFVQATLDEGADIEVLGPGGRTPFLTAAAAHEHDVIKELASRHASVVAVDDDGDNALHVLIKNSGRGHGYIPDIETVTLLRDLGVDPQAENKAGKTAIDLFENLKETDLAESDQEEIARVLEVLVSEPGPKSGR